jgi:hypothetical protein
MSEAERAALQTVFAAPGGGVPFYGDVLFMRNVLELLTSIRTRMRLA